MKLFFTAAISQKPRFGIYYDRINKVLKEGGYSVETGNLFEMTVDTISASGQEERLKWYKNSLINITQADLVVVEISFPSTVNVGYELSVALEKGKPVVALYKEDCDPIFLHGLNTDKLILVSYTNNDLELVLKNALEYVKEQKDLRFTMLLPSNIVRHLDQISREQRIARSEYIRKLIRKDMKNLH